MNEEKPGGDGSLPMIYITDKQNNTETAPVFQVVKLEKGQIVVKKEETSPTLFFILSGSLTSTPITLWPTRRNIPGRCLFFIPNGDCFYGKALEATTLFCCIFQRYLMRLKLPPAESSDKNKDNTDSNLSHILPLASSLLREIETIVQTPATFWSDPTYTTHKGSVLSLLMQHLYSPEDLARLFAPILHRDLDFRESILRNYHNTNKVKDLSKLLNIPLTTFNRKFREAFHTSAKEWFVQKRKEHLLNDILQTDMSLNEIADKYELTPNYLMKVCKESFNMTFTELRKSYAQKGLQDQPF